MMLTQIGWVVVHSLWQGAFIAGVTALTLGLLRNRSAEARYAVACGSLTLMALVPVLTAFTGLTLLRREIRPQLMETADRVVDLPALLWWGSVAVPLVGAVWLLGVGVRLSMIAIQAQRARALLRHGLADPGTGVRSLVAELRPAMVPDTAIDVWESARATVPMVLGWRRPVVLLPSGMLELLRTSQLRAVIAHELAHVRRGDYAVNLGQIALESLLFHHPAARWLSGVIRTEREYCCDDVAVAVGRDVADYARALATLEQARGDCHLAVAAGSGTLLDRLQRLAGQRRHVLTPLRGAVVLLLMSLAGGALLTVSLTIPPGLPWGAQIRRRVPPPPGTPAPSSPALPRGGEGQPRTR
jgi:beta-lactamase regulating signal transducer with metallopeptidase domain